MTPKRPTAPTGPTETDDNESSFRLTPIDAAILKLNHAGLSHRKIVQHLKTEFGIELAKSSVCRRLNELRQDPVNGVKTLKCSIPRKPKEEGKWYRIIKRLQEAIPEYTELNGFKPSLRTMFYQFQDEGIVGKHEYNAFIRATVEARLGWVDSEGNLIYPKLDIDCFADDDSRKSLGEYENFEPMGPIEPGPVPDPDYYITDYIDPLKEAVYKYVGRGEEGQPGQIGGRWYNQPEYVEVWEEKIDLLEAFYKILKDTGVKVRGNKGFPSLLFLNKCCMELKEVIDEMNYNPEHIWIKYAGDWDPSGEGMVYYIEKRLRQLGIKGVHVERIAVTPEQIDKYHLPLMPIDPENGKRPDPNLKEFRRRYGDKATHLNAFFTKGHIGSFKEILIDSVNKHWNQSIYDEMVEEYNETEPEEPEELTEEELEATRKRMCDRITEIFKPGWEDDL